MPSSPSSRPLIPAGLVISAVILVAAHLRPAATSVGPVLEEIRAALDMSATTAGILTALPGFMFALVGAGAVALSRRTGIAGALALGVAAICLGLLGRVAVTTTAPFLALTVLALSGMAIGNVLVPAFVKRWAPSRVAATTALYTTFLAVGATAPTLLAGPIIALSPGEGWRWVLGIWGITAAIALGPWIVIARRAHRAGLVSARRLAGQAAGHAVLRPVWHSRKALALGLFFGVQSMQAYVQFGWIAQMYRDGGLDQTSAALMASVIAAFGIPGGLLMPGLLARARRPGLLPVGFGIALAAGYLGVLLAPTTVPWLWAALLGVSGFAFPSAIALIALRSRDAHVTADLSGFTQSVGYLLAALGPLAVGALYDLTGSWTVPLLLLAGSSVVMIGAGWIAAAPGVVDDDLTAPGSAP